MERIVLVLPLALGLGLTACQKADSGSNVVSPQSETSGPRSGTPYEKEVIAIKAQNASQAEKVAAIRALAARYGIAQAALPAPAADAPANEPAIVPEAAPPTAGWIPSS